MWGQGVMATNIVLLETGGQPDNVHLSYTLTQFHVLSDRRQGLRQESTDLLHLKFLSL